MFIKRLSILHFNCRSNIIILMVLLLDGYSGLYDGSYYLKLENEDSYNGANKLYLSFILNVSFLVWNIISDSKIEFFLKKIHYLVICT